MSILNISDLLYKYYWTLDCRVFQQESSVRSLSKLNGFGILNFINAYLSSRMITDKRCGMFIEILLRNFLPRHILTAEEIEAWLDETIGYLRKTDSDSTNHLRYAELPNKARKTSD